jgi:hypothetical protein
MQSTYKCRCGTNLIVYEGERQVQCGVCGEKNRLPTVYLQNQKIGRQLIQLERQSIQPKRQSVQPRRQSLQSKGFLVRYQKLKYLLLAMPVFGLCLLVITSIVQTGTQTKPSSTITEPIVSSSPIARRKLPLKLSKLKPTPKPVQEPTDDHGVPFPAKSGYIRGYKPLRIGGYSSVTVDNSQNTSDVFVKLFTLDTKPPKAASVFFIRAHDSFTVSDIQPGNYDVRYRDLSSGGLSRTEPFNLKEVRTAGGVNFSRITMTLYKVQNGNMQTEKISEAEF